MNSWIVGAVIVLVVLGRRNVPGGTSPAATWAATTCRFGSSVLRIAFVVWLYVITDGAAFSPFSFLPDLPGGPLWSAVLMVVGSSDAARRVGAGLRRAVVAHRRDAVRDADPPAITL